MLILNIPFPFEKHISENCFTPPLRSIRVKLNESRCNSSSIEAGVLVAITGQSPTSLKGGMYYHFRKDSRPAPFLYPRPGERTRLLIRRFSSTSN
ncbi:hypothetical protein AVEN_265496-1 [Araneus ventricosus]|uniref:Uncharacterized protein n=1 Tax=Araneus ventricosus TaxID=182803 RepID=A0A4Y2H985_ARAVE|nr:hypothetical protein AVEN_265496-1 [Araneus ventricosus]